MGLSDLFKKRHQAPVEDQIYDLGKAATQLKKAKQYGRAIAALREAHSLMERTSTQYSVKHFLRVPMLLQLDGRAEEAWAEYQELLSSGYPGQMRSKDMILMDSYQIYDKMRLHLQREGRAKEAVVYHVLSIVCWSRALRLQNRSNEHEHTLTREYAAVQVEKVWRRTKLSTGAEGLASMLHDLLNGLEGMQLQSVEHQIREYLDGCGTGR